MTWMGPPCGQWAHQPLSQQEVHGLKKLGFPGHPQVSLPPPPPPGLHAIISSVANPFPHHSCLLRDDHWDKLRQPAAPLSETNVFLPERRNKGQSRLGTFLWRLPCGLVLPCPAVHGPLQNQGPLPVEQSVGPSAHTDAAGLCQGVMAGPIFTGGKVALQLKGKNKIPPD